MQGHFWFGVALHLLDILTIGLLPVTYLDHILKVSNEQISDRRMKLISMLQACINYYTISYNVVIDTYLHQRSQPR